MIKNSKHKDILRSILFMCGITLDNKYNFICAKCISNPEHTNYKNCRNEYYKTDPLAHFYCIMNYYKSQVLPEPPLDFQHIIIIVKRILSFENIPNAVKSIGLELRIKDNGELNIEEATTKYKLELLQILSRF